MKTEEEIKAIKTRIEELPSLYNEVTTSDLQGICQAIAFDINKDNLFEIEELLLSFAYGEIELNDLYERLGVF